MARLLFDLTRVGGLLLALLLSGNVYSNQSIHIDVQKSLVHLSGSATAETGDNAGEPGSLLSQATGFFVGRDGFVLTTKHFLDPLNKRGGFDVKVTATIGDAGDGNRVFPVKVVSELSRLDLLLLKVEFPFDVEIPKALKLGSSHEIDRSNPQNLFTSGFHGNQYRQLTSSFNKASSRDAPYVWSMNVKTNPGQSGSPVYFEDGTVVGLIKGVNKDADELTLVIPIEYALPLIGHFRIEKLEAKIEYLINVIGEIKKPDAPPFGERLDNAEKDLNEIAKQFFWSVDADAENGSLIIRYEKLVSGGPQIEKISIQLEPNMRMKGDVTQPMGALNLVGGDEFERSRLTPDRRVGEFEIAGVQESLQGMVLPFQNALRGREPFRDVVLTIAPKIGDEDMPLKKINLVPKYDWNYGPN